MTTMRTQSCVIPGCTLELRRKEDHVTLHRFPHSRFRLKERLEWIKIVRQLKGSASWEPNQHSEICSRHFEASKLCTIGKRRDLAYGAVPSKFLSLKVLTNSDSILESNQPAGVTEEAIVGEAQDTMTENAPFEEMDTNTVSGIEEDCPEGITSDDGKEVQQEVIVTCEQSEFTTPGEVNSEDKTHDSEPDWKSTAKSKIATISRKRLFQESPCSKVMGSCTSSSGTLVTPRSRKNLRREHNYADSPNRAADEVKKLKAEIKALKKKCSNLQEKLKRRDKSALSLKDKLQDMKVQLLSNEHLSALENRFPDLLKSILKNEKGALRVRGKTGMVYDDELRKFSATLHFYSPKAYSFLRDHLTLPHPNTIASWMKSTDCGPGFNSDVIKRLADARRADKNNVMTDIVMMIDEMAIHKEMIWNASKNCYVGHVDYGIADAEKDPKAKLAGNVLVCMIAGLSGGWKCPIGYIFTEKAGSAIQKSFLDRAFFLLEQEGFNVHTLTCDGNSANVSTFEAYGLVECPLDDSGAVSFDEIKASFCNPANSSKLVGAVYDVVHMIKLWRNILGECGELITGDGRTISWKYVEKLHEIQSLEKIRAANRLSRNHIEYKDHKMNVRLCVQVLSKSSADGIVFCREDLKLEFFKDSEATSKFFFMIDKVFDILNSRSAAQKGQKSPLTKDNLALHIYILEQFCKEVLTMRYTEVRNYKKTGKRMKVEKMLVQSLRKRAIIGMIISIKSIISVSKHLLYRTQSPFKYIMTYRFSQDLLELFFNKVRGRLGRNNNPNVLEFLHVMKRIWHQNLLKSTNTGNCINQMEEGGIPGGLLPLKNAPKIARLDDEEVEDLDLHGFTQPKNSPFYRNCLAYVAGNVIRVVGTKMKCEVCAEGLLNQEEDELDADIKLLIKRKDRGGLFTPCQSVFKLVELADAIFRQLVAESSGRMNIINLDKRIIKAVTENFIGKRLFPHMHNHVVDFDPLETESHLFKIIRGVVSHFLRIRLFDYGKRYQKFQVVSTRHKLNKLTLFKNQ